VQSCGVSKCAINPVINPKAVYIHSKIVTTAVRSGIGLTKLTEFDITDSVVLGKLDQIMERLLAEIKTDREEMKVRFEKMNVRQERMLTKMDPNQESMDAWLEEMKA
jgi:hypothetical protein